ncbi:MAG: type II secretion system GspH family protein [Candidatus Hydrogenedentes bacterium]|nr:type II secretion system GspH family protein [Candidatus Hydrogenedentota bacterium]
MVRFKRGMCGSGTRRDAGYTLMEVIVALAVLSAATYLIVGAFTGSVQLGERSITSTVAAEFAEEQLAELQRNPGAFNWPDETAIAGGTFGKITPKNADAAATVNTATPPETLPSVERLKKREQNVYERLSWEAYARLPKPDSLVYEVSVKVKWTLGGREQLVVLTTAMPKHPAGSGA